MAASGSTRRRRNMPPQVPLGGRHVGLALIAAVQAVGLRVKPAAASNRKLAVHASGTGKEIGEWRVLPQQT